jgi:uncharacterized membrane protein YhaH (DUF805 family)
MRTFLQRMFSIEGRVSRLGFWRFQVVQSLATAALWCLTIVATMAGGWLGLAPLLLIALVVAAAIYVAIRRLHDRNRSAWWLLAFTVGPYLSLTLAQLLSRLGAIGLLAALPLSLVGVVLAALSWIELGFRRGTRGPNRFGRPPTSNRAWLADAA